MRNAIWGCEFSCLLFHLHVSSFKVLLPQPPRTVTRACLNKRTSALTWYAQNSVANLRTPCMFPHTCRSAFTSEQPLTALCSSAHGHLVGGAGWEGFPCLERAAGRPLGLHVPHLCCRPSPCDLIKRPGTPSEPTCNKSSKTASLMADNPAFPLLPTKVEAGKGGTNWLQSRDQSLGM